MRVFGRRPTTSIVGQLTTIQSFFLDVFFHTFRNKLLYRPFSGYGLAYGSCRDVLVHVVEQMQANTRQDQISRGWLLRKWLCHFGARAQFFGKRGRYVGQRESRTAGHNELAFGEQGLSLAPFGDVFEGIDSDQEEKAIGFFQRVLNLANRINAVIRSRRHTSARAFLVMQHKFTGTLQQRGHESLFLLCRQRGHGVTMKVRSCRLGIFMRRNVRRNKIDSPQLAAIASSSGKRKVALVNGIEGAAKKADVHKFVIDCATLVVGQTEQRARSSPTARLYAVACSTGARRTSSTFSAIAYFSLSMPSPVTAEMGKN